MSAAHKERAIFIHGPIDPNSIAESIARHSAKTAIGAHELFLGQVRADRIDGKDVIAIDFSAYEEMALKEMKAIREETFSKWPLACLHVHHSIGPIRAGELCFMVFASAAHRKEAREAVAFVTDQVKQRLPIFGKEMFASGDHAWKVNH